MDEQHWLAERFEENRTHLRVLAYRMLGSLTDADDAVQEAWLRLSRSNAGDIENLGGWLTTVVARVCLDTLRSRRSRREEPLDEADLPEPALSASAGDPEHEAVLADSVGLALLVVLETLAPAERVAFVLHDVFSLPFEEIAPIVGRSTVAARQLASRARRRLQGSDSIRRADLARQRSVVEAFLAAARGGDFSALLAALDPDAVMRADGVAVGWGASAELRGATAVAERFAGGARVVRPALVDGAVGAVWTQRNQPRVIFGFTIIGGRIAEIDLIADPDRLSQIQWQVLK